MPTQPQLAFDFAPGLMANTHRLVSDAVRLANGLELESLSGAERGLLDAFATEQRLDDNIIADVAQAPDVLTEELIRLRSSEERRNIGQFFTPQAIVDVMVDWIARQHPSQIVDAGCGTGRFAIAAARALPDAKILAIDSDPVATILCRAHVKRQEIANVEVLCGDFLRDELPLDGSPVAFVGNPPYVRHHRLSREAKQWAKEAAAKLGVPFTKLAGLHAYFFLATALRAKKGDCGCYITSAEWLDVKYGKGLRRLLTGILGGCSLSMLDEASAAFEDAMTSAIVTCFKVGNRSRKMRISTVDEFKSAEGPKNGRMVDYEHLKKCRWGALLRGADADVAAHGVVRLGDLATVHRGIATGGNDFFVMEHAEAEAIGLAKFSHPVITSGKQVLNAGGCVRSQDCKAIVLLPKSLDSLAPRHRVAVETFLNRGVQQGIAERYLCRHRRPWWWLGAPQPPPIIASYMARRPPAFALNPDGVHILNIAHGIFPRHKMSGKELAAFTNNLNRHAARFVGRGRRYQGGLEKFEPREMEDLMIPPLVLGKSQSNGST